MKKLFGLKALLVLLALLVITGCTDITKSSNYETYELKYIVNLTQIDGESKDSTLKDLKSELNERLKNYDVAETSIELSEEDGENFVTVKFGTIDELDEIKITLEKDDEFILKKKLDVVYPHPRLVEARHLLISYSGAEKAGDDITRTKQEAYTLAQEVLEKFNNKTNTFKDLVKNYSDDKATNKLNGELETPAGRGAYVKAFENAAMKLENANDISEIIETKFGYHIIQAIEVYPEVLEEAVDGHKAELTEIATNTLEELNNGSNFKLTTQNAVATDPARIMYSQTGWLYEEEIIAPFDEYIFNLEPGEMHPELLEYKQATSPVAPPIEVKAIMRLIDKKESEKVLEFPQSSKVSHILIAYKDATRASEEVTRTNDEAFALAQEIKTKLDNGNDFVLLAREHSDDDSNKNTGGVLEGPAGEDKYVQEFEKAALALEEVGEISEIIESPFGYHIIKADEITPASEEINIEPQVKFEVLFFALQPKEWEDTTFTSDYLKNIETQYSKDYDPSLILHFSEDGKQALQELTAEYNGEIIGIFLGNELITSFTVRERNKEGRLNIVQPKTTQEADDLSDSLSLGKLPAPIIPVYDSSLEE